MPENSDHRSKYIQPLSKIMTYIDDGIMVLPEFQRGYVWKNKQVSDLFESLYKGYPVGSLLIWKTQSELIKHRGDQAMHRGEVSLLLDGQQRLTTLYSVIRGYEPSHFFASGKAPAFKELMFNLQEETFAFRNASMRGNPNWINVLAVMQAGPEGVEDLVQDHNLTKKALRLLGIKDMGFLVQVVEDDIFGNVKAPDKQLDMVVDMFDRVNSRGTTLSTGDLAMAKLSAKWPELRKEMEGHLKKWNKAWHVEDSGVRFEYRWLLRVMNAVTTGKVQFKELHGVSKAETQAGLNSSVKHIENCLNMILVELGLDHNRVLFGRFAIPVMAYLLEHKQEPLSKSERNKLLFWFAQVGMRGIFSGASETSLSKHFAELKGSKFRVHGLIDELRRVRGGNLKITDEDFKGWSLGAKFYPVLYMLTRMKVGRDLFSGIPLKVGLLGAKSRMEVHHLFPKSCLYESGLNYDRKQVNTLANFCFLTKETNLKISNEPPEEYFPRVEANQPGVLKSQWIPMDEKLWKVENYPDFLEERRKLLMNEANERLTKLYGSKDWQREEQP